MTSVMPFLFCSIQGYFSQGCILLFLQGPYIFEHPLRFLFDGKPELDITHVTISAIHLEAHIIRLLVWGNGQPFRIKAFVQIINHRPDSVPRKLFGWKYDPCERWNICNCISLCIAVCTSEGTLHIRKCTACGLLIIAYSVYLVWIVLLVYNLITVKCENALGGSYVWR